MQANLIFITVIALFALSYRARVSKKPHSTDKITLKEGSLNFSCDLPSRTPEVFEIELVELKLKGVGFPQFTQFGKKIIHELSSPAAAGMTQGPSPRSLEASSSALGFTPSFPSQLFQLFTFLLPVSFPPRVIRSTEQPRGVAAARQKQEKSSQQRI